MTDLEMATVRAADAWIVDRDEAAFELLVLTAARSRWPTAPRTHATSVRGPPAANEGLVIGRPVRNAVLRLIRGMDLRLHPGSVAPAEGHEKCGPRRPTHSGSSCNNAPPRRRVCHDHGPARTRGPGRNPQRTDGRCPAPTAPKRRADAGGAPLRGAASHEAEG